MERFNRLAHSVWDCKDHIVWIHKYRRKNCTEPRRIAYVFSYTILDNLPHCISFQGIINYNCRKQY